MKEKKRVLIADADTCSRKMLSVIFDDAYDISEAKDGNEVLDWIENPENDVDLLLIDLNMPRISGFEVLEHMKRKQLDEKIPVIVITASENGEDEVHAYEIGADEIIRKPFVPEVVLHRSDNLIRLYGSRKNMEQRLLMSMSALSGIQKKDILTGLPNRRTFLAAANELIGEMDADEVYSVIYTNVTNFKFYNMRNGIENGDCLLRTLAFRINEIRENILCGSFGQDHIVVITRDDTDAIAATVQKICGEFEDTFGHFGMQLKVGICRVKCGEKSMETAVELAKLACDSIRNAPDVCCEYDEVLSSRVEMKSYVIQHFDEALREGYIQVYYQPVIRTISGKTCGMEALARWVDPHRGVLSPAEFIQTLEENHLIAKLDLYILREVCRGIRRMSAEGVAAVPASINLSRMDFLEYDMFREVEQILREYEIPRDMLHIEITETAIMSDPERMKRDIDRFRSGGYQVWMDDFGSGYSSLNVLKDFQFDEIKLDMRFMASFDEKSKKIIQSIVSMAKQIGVQTLAEGVETQEQYEFLRYIGCEKVQGYLFGGPRAEKESRRSAYTRPERLEHLAWRRYYDDVGASDFVTEKALAVVEFDGQNFHFTYVNDAYKKVLEHTGASDMQMVYDNTNAPASPVNRIFRELKERCLMDGKPKWSVYSIRDHLVRINARRIAEHEECAAFEVEIIDLTGSESEKIRTEMDKAGRMLFEMFDTVFRVDLCTGEVKVLRHGEYGSGVGENVLQSVQDLDAMNRTLTGRIHPFDLERFRGFIDLTTLRARIEEAGQIYITQYFRTRIKNGAYVWKAHTILYLMDSETAIYSTRCAFFEGDSMIGAGFGQNESMQELADGWDRSRLMQGLMESRALNLFWKDTNRRFTGANNSFLKTCGFQDISEILGKTDEDMGWHIEDGPSAFDEKMVLTHGAVITNRPGVCIINGVAHNIIATKEPIYENGKIVGLIGCFADADALVEDMGEVNTLPIRDRLTGLMSPQGLINAIAGYVEEWQIRKHNFAAIHIETDAYLRANETYGENIARQMMWEVGQLIAQTVGVRGTCARLYSGSFVVLMKCREKDSVRVLLDCIQDRLHAVHTLAGYGATIQPHLTVLFADETKNILEILTETLINSVFP